MIRAFQDADLPAVRAVQLKCPRAAQWSEEAYRSLARHPGGIILVAELETASPPEVIGFAAFQQVADEGELQNIALDPAHQRRGYGRLLLQEGIGKLRESGARRIFLEVRASNHAACKLYASAGFSLLSTRKDYYQNPAEDALVLALDLMASTEAPLPMK